MYTPEILPKDIYVQPAGEGKVCGGCNQFLAFEKFSWNFNGKMLRYYRSSRCRDCKVAATKRWSKNAGKLRASRPKLMKAYGITEIDYAEILKSQNGACAICGDTEMPIDKRTNEPYNLAVDHCHKTGNVRSLLCPNCNNGLGCFKDDPNRLRAAIQYLANQST